MHSAVYILSITPPIPTLRRFLLCDGFALNAVAPAAAAAAPNSTSAAAAAANSLAVLPSAAAAPHAAVAVSVRAFNQEHTLIHVFSST